MSVSQPTHNYEFRVAETTSVSDLMGSGGTATYEGSATSNTTDGVIINNPNRNEGNFVNFTPLTFTDTTHSFEFYFTYVTNLTYTFFCDILETSSSSASSWTLTTNSGSSQFWAKPFFDLGRTLSTTNPTAGTAYHVVISFQKNGLSTLYINNTVTDTTSQISVTEYSSSPLTVQEWSLGRRARANDFYGDFKMYYTRYWDNHALTAWEVDTLYNNRSTNLFTFSYLRINYGDVYLAQTLNKTLADYKAENIPIQDISFGAFPANKYKQSYIKDLLDVSGSFIQRQHIFYSDMSFNVSDLSADQVIVNNDLSINSGFNIFQDSSFNSNVGIVGDLSINGTLTIEDNSIPESALNFTKPASNIGTFDSTQDVSMSSTFILQGDYERYIDLSQNIQSDFSENIVMIPSSLGIDLSGGTATLSGKTGDQAFLNGTYIVKDNSGNISGKIYDDLNNNILNNPIVTNTTTYSSNISNFPSDLVTYTVTHSMGATKTVSTGEELLLGDYSWSVTETAEGGNNSNLIRQLNGSTSTSYWFGINNGTLDVNDIVYVDDSGSNVTINGGTDSQHYIKLTAPRLMTIGQLRFASHTGNDINKVVKNVYVVGTDADGVKRLLGSKPESDITYATIYYLDLESTPVTDVYFIYQSRNGYHAVDIHAFQYLDVQTQTTSINTDTDNKLTSLPERWNTFQLQSEGGWLYDGSSNYTSYIDQYGRSQSVNGDNYDLILPFHFYPSKAFLRTLPVLPIGSTNPDNYPASVKFFGKSLHNDLSSNFYLLGEFENKATIVSADSSANYTHNSIVYLSTLPTAVYAWDFRVATSSSIDDKIQGVTATYVGATSTVEDGLAFTGAAAHATIPSGILIGSGPSELSFEIYFKYTTALPNWATIFDIQINSAGRFRMTQDGDRGYFAILYGNGVPSNGVGSNVDSGGTTSILNLSTSALVDTWIHFTATIEYPSDYATNGTIIRFYHNGTLINTVTGARYNTGTAASTTTDHIGEGQDGNDSNGNMKYLRFYNKKLSEEEVTSLYNSRDNRDAFNGLSDNYIHGADFLYDLNRKYYVNQLRMIVDKAPDSSGNSYGEYLIDRLAYSGSSFSGKKMESNNPNLYLNTAYDISYGFTEDHTTSVYDLSYNKNQFSILDVSGGGVVQVNPIIKLKDSSLNTEKITEVNYENKFQHPTYTNESVPTPFLYWELRQSTEDAAKVDTIQNKQFDTFDNITVSTATGAVVDSTSDGMGADNLWLTEDYTVEFYWTAASASVDSYATMIHVVDPNGVQNGYGGLWLRRAGNDVWTVNNGYTSASTNVISGNSDTAKDCALGTTNHVVLSVSTTNFTIKGYVNNVLVVDTTFSTPMENHLWETFSFGSALSSVGPSRYDCAGDYYYLRFYHTALNENQVTTLYNARNTINYNNWTYSFFYRDFYNYFGIRDASGLYNNRMSNDGKTIATLNNRGYEAYDVSNAQVVFSTDYGKNWKNVLQDCSDTFLFNENDISYNLLFATGDASGAIDIATSGNGRTIYLGRQSNVFKVRNNYSGLGKTDPPKASIPTDRSSGFPQSFFTDTYPFSNSTSTTQNYTISSSNNNTGITEVEGTYTLSALGNWTFYTAYGGYSPQYQFHNVGYNTSIYGDMRHPSGGGLWSYNYTVSNAIDANGNSASYTIVGIKFDFPSTITLHPTDFKIHHQAGTYTTRIFGEDVNGVTRLIFNQSITPSESGSTYSLSNIGDGLKSITWGISDYSGGDYLRLYNLFFLGTFSYGSGYPGISVPTAGSPEIYTTNYGNSWKLSPFKFHIGPTIISGDGSTILLLQQDKLNNDRHSYVSSLGNETSSIDCHWLTTDYGATWRTLNRTGQYASDDIIPLSYGNKTATFFKACMSYSGQYIYIYNVQCTTNSNYGELYYSHDYGVTFNKWVTSEAQTVITGTGQISCSGSGKYVYIAGTNSSSAFVYYRSTDYGISFNKDITKFPWQSYTLSESSTSAGPFISYEGDLIVTAGSNTSITTGNSDLQFSLDYGINYSDLNLNSDPVSTITNSFTNLPNKTNTLFTTTDVSTKSGIFANSPGPNEYKFLTNAIGQSNVSNIYLQTIEFPKDNTTKTIENEGAVFFTSEEPIDKENDFGQNITNTSTGSANKLWNIAVSEDGQKLLGGGAINISNGEYYSGYNLTNAKFPSTENVYGSTISSNGLPIPLRDYNFLITGAASSTIVDNISSSIGTYGSNVTSDTTNGVRINGDSGSIDQVSLVAPEFNNSYCFEMVVRYNTNDRYGGLFAFSSGSTTHNIICDLYATTRRFRFYSYASGSIIFASHSGGTHTGTTISTDGSSFHHLVFQYNAELEQAEYYQDGVRVWYQTDRTYPSNYWDSSRTYSGNAVGDINVGPDFNMKYFRIWNNRALSSSEITTLYNNQTTVYAANSWIPPLPHFKTANLSYDGNQALLVPYGITQTNTQNLYYWTASGDFHRFDGSYLSNFDAENWKFGKLSGDGNFFVGFTHSSTALSDASYNSDTWWTDPVSNTMIIYKTMQKISKGTVADATATTEAGGTTYDLNNAFASDGDVTSYYITHVNVSETGQYILVVGGNSTSTYTNRCALSSDFGVTFTDVSSKFSFTDVTKALVYCHVSDNGRYLFISQYNSNEYCFSTDYGNTFTLRNTFPSSTKTYGVVSRDGQNALFVDTNKYVYTSVNGNFRQEAIPALSGVNTGLSLTHNNWKYSSTLTYDLNYNPSMPNIKYFLGTGYNTNSYLTSSSVRYTGSYFSELDVKGSLTNLSGTGYTSSDYRVKENVNDLDESDSISSLRPISYTQNNLHHKKSTGFLAHEFAEIFPDLVNGEKDGIKMQSINYNGLIAILIKEIQTLRAKINKLKSEAL